MIKHKCIGWIAALLMVAAILVTGFAYINRSALDSITGTAEPEYVSVMDKTKVIDIQIIADEKEWADMLENATTEEYIPATVIINGTKIENVGIRPKGNSSLSTVAWDDTTDRFSFKIEFDHYITGQTWLGLDKLAVNNMQGDATYLKEYLSYDIMDYVGVESPLYAFTDISLNGETWGFYLAVECLEDSYAKRVYGNDHGQLYKPESMDMRSNRQMNESIKGMQNGVENAEPPQNNQQNQVQEQQRATVLGEENQQNMRNNRGGGMGGMSSSGVSLQYVGDKSASYSAIFDNSAFDTTEKDYKRVIEALEKLSNGEDIENTIDVEAVLKYFAAHTVVVNLDSYVSNMGHNYYLYEDNGQLAILPWDYNLAFGGFQSGNASNVVNFPIDTPVSGVSLADRPLLGKLLEVPEYMELYHVYLQQIVDDYFNSGLYEQTIDTMNTLISSHVKADPTAFYDYDAYKAAVVELKKLGLLRGESIEGQLDGRIPSTSEEQSANSSKLIDASGINLSVLGSQGGGMGDDRTNREQGGFGGNTERSQDGMQEMPNADRQVMQKAMEILQASVGENELTEEQLAQLKELGLTDDQITQFKNMAQGGMDGLRPNETQGGADNTVNQSPGSGNQQSVITSEYDTKTWLFIGGCVILLLAGLTFVVLFSRRRRRA